MTATRTATTTGPLTRAQARLLRHFADAGRALTLRELAQQLPRTGYGPWGTLAKQVSGLASAGLLAVTRVPWRSIGVDTDGDVLAYAITEGARRALLVSSEATR